MAPKIHTTQKKLQNNQLIQEVTRPQRKRVSRYKLKKQEGIAAQILDDMQILNV